MASDTLTKPFYIIANTPGFDRNDRIASTGEIPYVADYTEWLPGSIPSFFTPVTHAGSPVVATISEVGGDQECVVRSWDGAAWNDLGFPTLASFAAPDAAPRERPALASDGTTLWLALIINETTDFGAYLYSMPGSTWFSGDTYIFAYTAGVWSLVYYRAAPTLNYPALGILATSPGGLKYQLGTHPAAGYAWLCSLEFGNRGDSTSHPFTTSLAISTKVDTSGVLEEHFGINYGELVDRPTLYSGVYYGPDHADDGTVIVGASRRIEDLITDAGFPLYLTDVFADADVAAVQGDTFAELQTLTGNGISSGRSGHEIHNDLLYLNLEPADPASYYYPEEVADGFTIRNLIYTLPLDASAPFAPLLDRNGENVALAKNPLQNNGIENFLAAMTGPHRPWIPSSFVSGDGNEYVYLFVLNDACPWEAPLHGRYGWDFAKDAFDVATPITPARGGEINVTLAHGYKSLHDPDNSRIYIFGWAKDSAIPGGHQYLRVWYFDLCEGCVACPGSAGLHVWQRI